MKIAYFDTFSGISGDMTVGALLHLGLPWEAFVEEMCKLPLSGYRLGREERIVHGIRGIKFQVAIEAKGREEKSFPEIVRMIESASLLPQVAEKAIRIFTVLAEAEGRVHGVPPEKVHFHEVGAVDSIIDIVGTAFGLHALGIEEVFASALPLGKGLVPSRHGMLPVPAPATAELVRGMRVHVQEGEAEMVTPTGAAILAALARHDGVPEMEVEGVGYGAGERELSDRPNLLRVLVGRRAEPVRHEDLLVLETNIDDLNPELYEHVTESLFATGAKDVFLAPIQMKKGRPGTLLWVLAQEPDREKLSTVIFRETSTLGVRYSPVKRITLRREVREVATAYGPVRIKIAYDPEGRDSAAPEYEDCRRLAQEKNVPLKVVYQEALRAYRP